ncbi:sulfite exporter TauE/SafE family protein [Algoriphagus sp. NG3]|uniref:sulfite exporter TauE/SafE family protein n=1 Tax=Algoriphagus sp. NG3 TaxID=3097546 RepID=UPI002A83CB1F|nr:sulfite exporter TauE/SafE family protein [Algoriphagus sp. NG3]WPR76237.1 sulfite exporter TauE/SafE family protein [Algoriphagus sp. NG3]
MLTLEYLPFLFFIIALFYSSVGFGGGSSYLALMSLFLTDFHEIRSTALLLNICVVSIGTFLFIRSKVFDIKSFWPFLVSSIPVAYLGAQLRLSQQAFFLVLGSALILSGLAMLLRYIKTRPVSREFSLPAKIGLGGSVGLLAGVSGIGGGIFLSPTLNLLNWASPRTIAALASVFILVNSIAGLVGLTVADTFTIDLDLTWKLILGVVLGGSIGSYLSNKKFNLRILGGLTAVLVIYVGLRLVLMHGFGINI